MAISNFFDSAVGFGAKGALGGGGFASAPKIGGGFGSLNPSIGFGSEGPLTGEQFVSLPKKKGMWDKLSTFNNLFDKTKETSKWQDYAKEKPFGGEWSKSGAGQVLENLGVVYPQQHSPMFIPGMPGESGKGGAIGKAAGLAVGLAAAPFTGGASLGALPFLTGAGGTIGGVFD